MGGYGLWTLLLKTKVDSDSFAKNQGGLGLFGKIRFRLGHFNALHISNKKTWNTHKYADIHIPNPSSAR